MNTTMTNGIEHATEELWGGLTKNTAMIVSFVGAVMAICAAVYVFMVPNERLGRGVVTLFALFTILIACAYVYTTHCVREGKCYAWSYVYSGLCLAMGVLSMIYAFTSKVVTPAFTYPNSVSAVNQRFSDGSTRSPALGSVSHSSNGSVKSVGKKKKKLRRRIR